MMHQYLTKRLGIDQCSLKDKRVLVRVDYDGVVRGGRLVDPGKITSSLPTIQLALRKGARSVVLISHNGRPGGQVDKSLTLQPVADELSRLLNQKVQFLEAVNCACVEAACAHPVPGSVILLENLGYHVGEEGRSVDDSGRDCVASAAQIRNFRSFLSKLGDVYVNDSFSVSNSTRSSVVGCYMKQRAAGLLLQSDLQRFSSLPDRKRGPTLAIICGPDVTLRFRLIQSMLGYVDSLVIGGEMAVIFHMVLHEMKIGASTFDEKEPEMVTQIVQQAARNQVPLYLPVDFLVADSKSTGALTRTCRFSQGIPDGMFAVDIGGRTIRLFDQIIRASRTIVWCGLPGHVEVEEFSHGSRALFNSVKQARDRGATSILLGEDMATFAARCGDEAGASQVRAETGAGLDLLEGRVLPGILFLSRTPRQRGQLDKQGLTGFCLSGKRLVVLADLDVPVSINEVPDNHKIVSNSRVLDNHKIVSNSKVLDNHKIVGLTSLIRYAFKHGARSVVLLGHLGSPTWKPASTHSLRPVAEELATLLDKQVIFVNSGVGAEAEAACGKPRAGSVFMLQNLGFHPEEAGLCFNAGSRVNPGAIRAFGQSLSKLGDIFVNDCFPTCHTTFTSVVGVNAKVKVAGFTMMKELHFYKKVMECPDKPFLLILGGSSLEEKVELVDHLMELADDLIVTGGLTESFLRVILGSSDISSDQNKRSVGLASVILGKADVAGVQVHLSRDLIIAQDQTASCEVRTVQASDRVPTGWQVVDVGGLTRTHFHDVITRSRTVVWSGSPGMWDTFSEGTRDMTQSVVQAAESGATSIILGDDTVAVYTKFRGQGQGAAHLVGDHGAAAHLLKGSSLPGINYLDSQTPLQKENHTLTRVMTATGTPALRVEKEKNLKVTRQITSCRVGKLPPLKKTRQHLRFSNEPPLGSRLLSPARPACPKPTASCPHRKSAHSWSALPNLHEGRMPLQSSPPKLRVPVQLETLVTLDTDSNMCVHINGHHRHIPEEAQVQVTLVRGYVPKTIGDNSSKKSSSNVKRRATLTPCQDKKGKKEQLGRSVPFKQLIALSALSEKCDRHADDVRRHLHTRSATSPQVCLPYRPVAFPRAGSSYRPASLHRAGPRNGNPYNTR